MKSKTNLPGFTAGNFYHRDNVILPQLNKIRIPGRRLLVLNEGGGESPNETCVAACAFACAMACIFDCRRSPFGTKFTSCSSNCMDSCARNC